MNALGAVAFLVHLECQRVGKLWDPQGVFVAVRASIEEDGRRPDQVVLAGFAAANDPSARTPAAIRWAARYPTPAAGSQPAEPKCRTCNYPKPRCRELATKTGDPHRFQPYAHTTTLNRLGNQP